MGLSSSPKTFTMSDKWSTGLFDCTSDMETCCTVCFAGPGVPYARVNRIVYGSPYCTAGSCCLHLGSSNGVMPASACFCMGPQYTQVKLKLGITEKDACGDCCCVCLCHSCAQCRVVRELKARGIYTEEQMNGQLPSTLAPSNMTMIKDR